MGYFLCKHDPSSSPQNPHTKLGTAACTTLAAPTLEHAQKGHSLAKTPSIQLNEILSQGSNIESNRVRHRMPSTQACAPSPPPHTLKPGVTASIYNFSTQGADRRITANPWTTWAILMRLRTELQRCYANYNAEDSRNG